MNPTTAATPRTVTTDTIGQFDLEFELDTCTRCGGSGTMPYKVLGGACLRCNRLGVAITLDGKAARKAFGAFHAKQKVFVTTVQVGDYIDMGDGTPGSVTSVEDHPHPYLADCVGILINVQRVDVDSKCSALSYVLGRKSRVHVSTPEKTVALWNQTLTLPGAHLVNRVA